MGQEVAWTQVPASLEKRFTIVEPFASGGTGSLYIADEPETGRRAMLKVIPKAPKAHQAERQRARRELVKQATLSSSHVAVPLSTGEADESLWLFREWIDGISLRVRLHRSGALPEHEALAIGAQLAAGLDDLHRAGLLHRALKPEHVMLVPSRKGAPRAVLIDAGIGRPVEGLGSGLVVGTPGYVAPEQVQGKLVSFRSDLYALGCVMYEMLTGRPAFSGSDVSTTLAAQLRGELPPMPDSLPQGIAPLLTSLLARDPQDRPFSAQKLRRTLDPFLPDGTPVIRQSNTSSSPLTDDQKPSAASGGTVRPPPPPPPTRALSRPPPAPTGKSIPPPPPPSKKRDDATVHLDIEQIVEVSERVPAKAPEPQAAKSDARMRDATQPVDFDTVLSVTSTRPSNPPPTPEVAKKPEYKPTADHTQPIRLDQILAVAETRRKSSAELPPVPVSTPPEPAAPAAKVEPAPAAKVEVAPVAKVEPVRAPEPEPAPKAQVEAAPALSPKVQEAPQPKVTEAIAAAKTVVAEKPAEATPAVAVATPAQPVPADDDRTLIDIVDDEGEVNDDEVEDAKTVVASAPSAEAKPSSSVDLNPSPPALHKPTDDEIEALFAADTPPSGSVRLDDAQPSVQDARGAQRTLIGMPKAQPLPPATGTTPRGSDAPPPMSAAEVAAEAASTPMGLDSQQLTLPRDPAAAIAEAARMEARGTPKAPEPVPRDTRKTVYAALAVAAVLLLSFGIAALVREDDTAVAKQDTANTPSNEAAPQPAASKPVEQPAPAVMPLAEAPKPEPKVEAITPPPAAPAVEEKKPEPAPAVVAEKREEPAKEESSERSSRSERRRAERAEREAQEKSESESAGGKTNEEAWGKARDEARAHYAAGRYKEAADAYAKAAKYNPGHAGTWSGLGGSRLKANDPKGAVQAYQKAVKISPETSGFHAALGRAYLAAGENSKAKAAYKKALALDPNNEAAKAALAEL